MTAGLGKQHALMDTFNEIWFGFFFYVQYTYIKLHSTCYNLVQKLI